LKAAPEIVEADAECCGQHEICEKESLLAAVSKKIEYYDDEELDRFRGRPSNGYNEEEVEEFREIMYTCKEDEVAGWSRSLQLLMSVSNLLRKSEWIITMIMFLLK
jgi:hypothetical protein